MPRQHGELLAAVRIPDAGGLIYRCCDHVLAFGVEGNGYDGVLVTSQDDKLAAADDIPDTSRGIVNRDCYALAVWREPRFRRPRSAPCHHRTPSGCACRPGCSPRC